MPGNHEYFTGHRLPGLPVIGRAGAARETRGKAASDFCPSSEDDGWQFLGLEAGFYGHTMAVSPRWRRGGDGLSRPAQGAVRHTSSSLIQH
ncbi:MAG TPA: hypothetical protein VLK84_09475 [Longimicrobium sp.]|nr:hypothetical protein [Longimicrobium sp.]